MDEPSLSDRAAQFTAAWNEAASDRDYANRMAAPRPMSFGGPTASNGAVLALAAVIGGVAGSLGGGEYWYLSMLLFAAIFPAGLVVLYIAGRLIIWITEMSMRGTDALGRGTAAVNRGLSGLPAAIIGGTALGAIAGAAIASVLGGDIPMMEGVTMFAPVGAVLGIVYGVLKRNRR